MIKLHYAEGKNLDKEIVEINLEDTVELNNFMKGIVVKDDGDTVYLFTSDHSSGDGDDEFNEYSREIYIESDPLLLSGMVKNILDYSSCIVFLQEYANFEDAYKVALDMRELNHLCYDMSPKQ